MPHPDQTTLIPGPFRKTLLATALASAIALGACTSQKADQPIDASRQQTGQAAEAKEDDRQSGNRSVDRDRQGQLAAKTETPGPADEREESPVQSQTDPRVMADRATEARKSRHDAEYHVLQRRVPAAPPQPTAGYVQAVNPTAGETYAELIENTIRQVASDPVSTFSIDVDTGAYSNVRRMLEDGMLPPADAVRVEEMINYFDYGYEPPRSGNAPFNVITELADNPWRDQSMLLHIGLKGQVVDHNERPASNLVFLIDVSGSMQSADKLALLKPAMKMLSGQLSERDRVSIVVYAGAAGEVLSPTAGNDQRRIGEALDRLAAGGSTNGGAGIELAYSLARDAHIDGGINRVILATDGDFNVGNFDVEALKSLVKSQRDSGIELTTLGFGTGNYNDQMMEQLANIGNGNYFYIDSMNEARKVLVEDINATLQTIASDVKIQVEFNPEVVREYRLIGYENRALRREDFNNDKIDAGEIGAGHTVTALYELTLTDQPGLIDPLRYGSTSEQRRVEPDHDQELAFLKLRYKPVGQSRSELITTPILRSNAARNLSQTSEAFRFSAAVAGFGQRLRGSDYLVNFDYTDVLNLAREARGSDPHGYRSEFLQLVELAATLDNSPISLSHRP